MLESDMEYLMAKYPKEFFPDMNLLLLKRQYFIAGRRIDILFQNEKQERVVIELKRGKLSREAVGQIAEYYGLLQIKNSENKIHLILCANNIPDERKIFLQHIGIKCYEFTETNINDIATKYNYIFGSKVEVSSISNNYNKPKDNNGMSIVTLEDLLGKIRTIDGRNAINAMVNRFNGTNNYRTDFKPFRNTYQCRFYSVEEGKYYFSFVVNCENLHVYIMNPARLMLIMENSIGKIKGSFPESEEKSNEIVLNIYNENEANMFLDIVIKKET